MKSKPRFVLAVIVALLFGAPAAAQQDDEKWKEIEAACKLPSAGPATRGVLRLTTRGATPLKCKKNKGRECVASIHMCPDLIDGSKCKGILSFNGIELENEDPGSHQASDHTDPLKRIPTKVVWEIVVKDPNTRNQFRFGDPGIQLIGSDPDNNFDDRTHDGPFRFKWMSRDVSHELRVDWQAFVKRKVGSDEFDCEIRDPPIINR